MIALRFFQQGKICSGWRIAVENNLVIFDSPGSATLSVQCTVAKKEIKPAIFIQFESGGHFRDPLQVIFPYRPCCIH